MPCAAWFRSGTRFNIKMTPYQYRKSHCGDTTISRPSYLHNGISNTGKRTCLYWIGALLPNGNISVIFRIYQSAAFAWFDSLILVNPGKHWTSTPVPTVVIGMLPSDVWRFGFAFNKSFPTVYFGADVSAPCLCWKDAAWDWFNIKKPSHGRK